MEFNVCCCQTSWCHDIEALFTLLALHERIHRSSIDSPHKGSVMSSFDDFFVVSMNMLLNNYLLEISDAMDLLWLCCVHIKYVTPEEKQWVHTVMANFTHRQSGLFQWTGAIIESCQFNTACIDHHNSDIIMGVVPSQITSLMIVHWTVYSGADQRKHHSSASLAFVRGIHRGPVNSPHKCPVTRKMFPFDDVIMTTTQCIDHKP